MECTKIQIDHTMEWTLVLKMNQQISKMVLARNQVGAGSGRERRTEGDQGET